MPSGAQRVIANASVTEYFRHSLTEAMAQRRLRAADETVSYVVRLLSGFVRAEHLFDDTPDGPMLKPLAGLYAEAVSAPSREDRAQALRRLGDVALFVAGVFSDSLNRKPVDVDYYIAMGGNAYGHLAETGHGASRDISLLVGVFDELSEKFARFVDVLTEVGDGTSLQCAADVLRLYELWLRTGSERAARRLSELGIAVAPNAVSRLSH